MRYWQNKYAAHKSPETNDFSTLETYNGVSAGKKVSRPRVRDGKEITFFSNITYVVLINFTNLI